MKNISRRVFIKGMAVAAAATAASTVLAGCNFVPGTEEPEVVPTPANTYTYTDGEKALSIAAPKFDIVTYNVATGNEDVYITMNVENKLGEDVKFVATKPGSVTAKEYVVVVTSKVLNKDGSLISTSLSNQAVTGYTNLLASPTVDKDTYVNNGVLCFKALSDKWAKITVTMKVYKAYANGTKYALEVNESGKTEFTFTK